MIKKGGRGYILPNYQYWSKPKLMTLCAQAETKLSPVKSVAARQTMDSPGVYQLMFSLLRYVFVLGLLAMTFVIFTSATYPTFIYMFIFPR